MPKETDLQNMLFEIEAILKTHYMTSDKLTPDQKYWKGLLLFWKDKIIENDIKALHSSLQNWKFYFYRFFKKDEKELSDLLDHLLKYFKDEP